MVYGSKIKFLLWIFLIISSYFLFKVQSKLIRYSASELSDIENNKLVKNFQIFKNKDSQAIVIKSSNNINSVICLQRIMNQLRKDRLLDGLIELDKPLSKYIKKYSHFLLDEKEVQFLKEDLEKHNYIFNSKTFSEVVSNFSDYIIEKLLDERYDEFFQKQSKYSSKFPEVISSFLHISYLYNSGEIELNTEEYKTVLEFLLFSHIPSLFFQRYGAFFSDGLLVYPFSINFDFNKEPEKSSLLLKRIEEHILNTSELQKSLNCDVSSHGKIYENFRQKENLKKSTTKSLIIANLLIITSTFFLYKTYNFISLLISYIFVFCFSVFLYALLIKEITIISSTVFVITGGIGIDYLIHSFHLREKLPGFWNFSRYTLKITFKMFITTFACMLVIWLFSDLNSMKYVSIGVCLSLSIFLILSVFFAWLFVPCKKTSDIVSPKPTEKMYGKQSIILFLLVFLISLFFSSRVNYRKEIAFATEFDEELLKGYKYVEDKLGFFPLPSYVFTENLTKSIKLLESDLIGKIFTINDWLPKADTQKTEKILSEVNLNSKKNNKKNEYKLRESLDQLTKAILAVRQFYGLAGLVSEGKESSQVISYIKQRWYNIGETKRIDKISSEGLKLIKDEVSTNLKTKYPNKTPSELEEEFGRNGTYIVVYPQKFFLVDNNLMKKYVSILEGVTDNFSSLEAVFLFAYEITHKGFSRLVPLSFLVIPVILLLIYKKVRVIFLCVIPLLFGFSVGLCVLKIFNGYIDLTTPLAAALIFGTGIDDFIAIYSVIKQEGLTAVPKLLKTTFLTSFTTAASGIGLMFASSESLRYFGLFLCVSMMTTWTANSFLIPSIIKLTETKKRGGEKFDSLL